MAISGCGASPTAIDLARTRPLGRGPAFRPPALGNRAVAVAAPVGTLRCAGRGGTRYGAHVELFAQDRGVAVSAGIGIAPPQIRRGPFVQGGRCSYPLRTTAPTGVVEVDQRARSGTATVGALFALWGQPLSARRLGGFDAARGSAVLAFVDGRRWEGDPRSIPLRRHAQIVLEVGPRVEPHPAYAFPPGL